MAVLAATFGSLFEHFLGGVGIQGEEEGLTFEGFRLLGVFLTHSSDAGHLVVLLGSISFGAFLDQRDGAGSAQQLLQRLGEAAQSLHDLEDVGALGHVAIGVVRDFVVEYSRLVEQLFAFFVAHEFVQAFEHQGHFQLRFREIAGAGLQAEVYDFAQAGRVATSGQQRGFHFLRVAAVGTLGCLGEQSHQASPCWLFAAST